MGIWGELRNVRGHLSNLIDDHNSPIAAGTLFLLASILAFNILLAEFGVEWVPAARETLLFQLGILYPIGVFVTGAVLFFLFVSQWGKLMFGDDESTPEFSNFTYFAMLFSANLAAGIAFFGPGEAIFYLEAIPPGIDPTAGSVALAEWGIGFTLIHWGIPTTFTHYVIAPPIAYYCYRRGAPFRISTAFYPLLKDRTVLSAYIDTIGIAVLILGLASSVAEVTANFLAGISFQWAVPDPTLGTILFLIALTLVFTASTVTGLHRGIPRLSVLSVYGFVLVAGGVLLLGPTVSILEMAVGATLNQPAQFATLATNIQAEWTANWTILNWAIWITGATGLGLFAARISYGRSLREFIAYSCIATALANMVWFYVLGGAVIRTHLSGKADILNLIKEQGFAVAGYPMFLTLPVGELFLFLFLGLGLLFLITLADSMMLSVAMTTSAETASPPRTNRWFWGGIVGIATIVLTLFGGIDGANMLAVMSGLIVIFLAVVSQAIFLLSLRGDDDTPDLF